MNLNWEEAKLLLAELNDSEIPADVEVIIAPPAPYLSGLSVGDKLHLAAQNVHSEASGAYTGEFSAAQIKSLGLSYAIVGHSERRAMFGESDSVVASKVKALLSEGMSPIFCCGESLDERESEEYFDVIRRQVEVGLFELVAGEFANCIIAYEPVWAIGTGKTATTEQAQEMHAFIRSLVVDKFGEEVADNTSILYGGSCKPSNADELFACADVDGGLIGGASLKSEDFLAIIRANSRS